MKKLIYYKLMFSYFTKCTHQKRIREHQLATQLILEHVEIVLALQAKF